ncbi:MAG: hypothetical protein EAY69_09205 [Cytophagales bacterium]|nr:MAG: hypothetical protein EAY69_09205 [Cytophagales bacterium]
MACVNNTTNTQKKEPKQDGTYIVPQWGSRFYKAHKGKTEAIEHIWLRHNFNSTYDNVSRFGKEYKSRDEIKKVITEALKNASKEEVNIEGGGHKTVTTDIEGGGHKTVTTDMKKIVGLSQKGKPTSKIRIHLDNKDFVKSAYPY